MATAFVTRPEELLAVRCALGAAEAGFAPGVILYFNSWFPRNYQGRVLGGFFFIAPMSLIIGGPLSSVLLSWNGRAGLAGWQWLFIVEALPTLLLALAVFICVAEHPGKASWLTPGDSHWLEERMRSENGGNPESPNEDHALRALSNGPVWALAVVYLGISAAGAGAVFFMPLMIRTMGFSIWASGWVIALPAAMSALSLPLWGLWADRSTRRPIVVAIGCACVAMGLLGAALLLPSAWALLPISLSMVGFFGCLPAFWTLPSTLLRGASAATGIALINTVGSLGNLLGPTVLGRTLDLFGSYGVGLISLAAVAGFSATLLTTSRDRIRSR
jgi:ACS family tartrate transporter-like MFS transporter